MPSIPTVFKLVASASHAKIGGGFSRAWFHDCTRVESGGGRRCTVYVRPCAVRVAASCLEYGTLQRGSPSNELTWQSGAECGRKRVCGGANLRLGSFRYSFTRRSAVLRPTPRFRTFLPRLHSPDFVCPANAHLSTAHQRNITSYTHRRVQTGKVDT